MGTLAEYEDTINGQNEKIVEANEACEAAEQRSHELDSLLRRDGVATATPQDVLLLTEAQDRLNEATDTISRKTGKLRSKSAKSQAFVPRRSGVKRVDRTLRPKRTYWKRNTKD